MRRIVLVLAALAATLPAGCRSIGRFPTIDPTDYAYFYFNGVASQVYQFTPPQIESTALIALADLGYTKVDRKLCDGLVVITALTPDLRHCRITIRPQDAMSRMTVFIGLFGDEMVSRSIFQRVSMSLGTLPRVVIPIEPALERRFNIAPPLEPSLPRVVSLSSTLPIGEPAIPLVDPATPEADPAPPVPSTAPSPFGPPVPPDPELPPVELSRSALLPDLRPLPR